ncbi:alpha/beta fold hydrolase [Actinocatenispora rupis]|uniref:Alpha/beta hydrolase n=1 Tax=Actinocatenispora rupis TaxID=519421 RepID=A0A8J3NDC7_9ACTN|nr:alpha/beta fold hydrolase [Actinocatenispora rupis]GID12800.1 alpha/beta hydrolase [Actinocatenispora rupis]
MEIGYTEAGRGVPLVLLHAFPLTAAMWVAQRTGLADTCRVITPDQRGFGASKLPDDEPDLGTAADDLRDLLDLLELPDVVLGGLSMGGYVAFEFLRRHPERVRGLVLADTKATADQPAAAENRLRIAAQVEADGDAGVLRREVVPNLIGATTRWQRPEVYETVAALAVGQPPAAVAWAQRAMAARPDSTDLLPGIAVPTLVIVGEDDAVTPPEDAILLANGIPGAHLRRIPAAGHLTALEAPERFNTAVRTLLDRL